MAKIWVLDTETKGTGAEMVPLDKIQRKPDPSPQRPFVPPQPQPRPERPPEPKPAPRFRVVDVLSGRPLVEGATGLEAVAVLEDRRSVVDVTIDVWDSGGETWRRLTHGERKMLWDLRGRRARADASQEPA
jgi:hypothetical protein